jgi:hypothetical protein
LRGLHTLGNAGVWIDGQAGRVLEKFGRQGAHARIDVSEDGGESEAAWRALLDDLVARGLAVPELVIIDGAAGLEKAIAALWNDVPVQRCTVHKHRNLLAHAPKKLYDEISADYADMIYANTAQEVEAKRKAFLRKCAERTEQALRRRTGQFVRRLPAEACANFFTHAGYAVSGIRSSGDVGCSTVTFRLFGRQRQQQFARKAPAFPGGAAVG